MTLFLEEQLGWIIERSDNKKPKITGLNGVGGVCLRSDIENADSRWSDNMDLTVCSLKRVSYIKLMGVS